MHDDATTPAGRGTDGAPPSSGEPAPPTPHDPADGRTRGARPARAARKQVLLRLDPAVHDAVAHWAADDLRSVNAQIEYALRDALRRAGRLKSPEIPTPKEDDAP